MYGSIEELFKKLSTLHDYERQPPSGVVRTFGLENVRTLSRSLRLEENTIPIVQVVGSKGKGTTATFLSNRLQQAGLRVGLYQSPHLFSRTERILVQGRPASEASWLQSGEAVLSHLHLCDQTPSRFEVETILAYHLFYEEKVDVIIAEAGLGGVADATSVLSPVAIVLTTVELEHTHILGDTLFSITSQKIGHLPEDGKLFVGGVSEEVKQIVAEVLPDRESDIVDVFETHEITDVRLSKSGISFLMSTQLSNSSCVVELPLFGKHIPQTYALAHAVSEWILADVLGRGGYGEWGCTSVEGKRAHLERVDCGDGILLVDVAHTMDSVKGALSACREHFGRAVDRVVFGVNVDKKVDGLLTLLLEESTSLWLVRNPHPKGMSAQDLYEMACMSGECDDLRAYDSVDAVCKALQAQGGDKEQITLVLGSYALAGAVLEKLA